jgi:polyhydroxyalkanoate synthase
LFIDHSQVAYVEDLMWSQGYLEGGQMAGAFQLLRSNDLLWSRLVHDYLLGQREPMFDLMAWNADTTRMPYRMHSEYLEKLFLNNDFSHGRMIVDGRHIAITDIHAPIFSVATEKDHISPWHSVYKINLLTDTDVTFLLTNGGHNAGVVSEPGHKGRYYRVATKHEPDRYVDPETWRERAPVQKGSWWPEWHRWLVKHSSECVKPPTMGASRRGFNVICEAPGEYVFG